MGEIKEITASFSFQECDKCNSSGCVEKWETVDMDLYRDRFINYSDKATNFNSFIDLLFEFRDWQYEKIKCPKCNGKRQIAVLDENLVN